MNDVMVPYRSHRPLAGLGCQSCAQPMGDLGLSLLKKIVKISTPGPNAVKLKATPNIVKKGLAVAGPALSFIPGWGTLAAAGAAVITVADQRQKAKRLQDLASQGQGSALVQEYPSVAGSLPGRAMGLDLIQKLWEAAVQSGLFRTNGQIKQPRDVNDVLRGCGKCGPDTVANSVDKALAAGVLDPRQIIDQFYIPEVKAWKNPNKWQLPSSAVERQLVIDAIDATVASKKSDAPVYYGQASETPASATPATVASPAPVTSSTAASITAATVPVDQTASLIQSLLAQGATQQQAYAAAIQSLAAQGVPASPQVQQQVASDVTSAAARPASFSPALALGLVGGIALLSMLAGRKKGRA